ncbi:hypothetical protein CBW65_08925 [Tumebacillus avium]|uniref:HTH cro/C1-type domain-containing protein n=1 Tax=Tumebacillus avium TaxID=1903704 RepID=A0A1Y0ILI4_9BACL|nr:helix-turn-helix transcriptional regulator [Tumebacillus avium]ARU61140.1 hypothetical protein CBW65_08925 [Tumebacillus avium]
MEKRFGSYLREKQAKDMSIRQLALYAGCSDSYLSSLERNISGTRGPSPAILQKFSKPLGVPFELLLQAAGYFADFHNGVEVVPVPILSILRESLQDSEEVFAKRLNLTVDELSKLEGNPDLTAGTVRVLFDNLFARQAQFTSSGKRDLLLIEQTFEQNQALGRRLQSLLQWFFETEDGYLISKEK